uniref:Nucleic-acid-binding protein from transposon X-element n=1 Tax=Loa loa TaxID=7209 RepID=A0A1I7W059_LOALO
MPNCLTVKQRFERLKDLKACTNCFRTMHATSDCKQRKLTCFHCKGNTIRRCATKNMALSIM